MDVFETLSSDLSKRFTESGVALEVLDDGSRCWKAGTLRFWVEKDLIPSTYTLKIYRDQSHINTVSGLRLDVQNSSSVRTAVRLIAEAILTEEEFKKPLPL